MPIPTLTGSVSELLVAPAYCFTDDGITQAAVGQAVKRWYNVAGLGFFQQTTTASRPILRQDSANRYYLEFDGVDDYMDVTTGLFNGATISYSIALTLPRIPTTTSAICRCNHSGSSTSNGIFIDAGHIQLHARSSGLSIVANRYRDIHPGASVVAQNVWDTTNDILYHRLYGSATGSGSLSGATLTPGTLTHFRIGANSGASPSQYTRMNLYALVYGNGLWTSTERADLETYHAGLVPTSYISPSLSSLSSASTLWTSGTGYNTYRIPTICWYDDGTSNGIIYSACEGRSSTADDGDVDIVFRKSTDLGATWSASAVAQANGSNVAGNPCLIPDPANSKLHLIFQRQTAGDGSGHGATTRRCWYTYTSDGGTTWATATEITAARDSGWSWLASGPGRGVVLPNGRIVVPFNHSDATYGSPYYKGHLLYSDDGGATWSKSSPIGPVGANEMALDVVGDGVLCTIRNQASGGSRLFMLSSDGSTVSDATSETDLAGNACHAGMVVMGGRMLLSHVASSTRRECVVLSGTDYDADPTFDKGTEISYGETGAAAGAAYSQMCRLPGNLVGIVWEYGSAVDSYNEIKFNTFAPTGTLIAGTLSATQDANSVSATGAVAIAGTLSVIEGSDSASATGAVAIAGTLTATESGNTIDATATIGTTARTATLTAAQADNTIAAAGTLPIVGTSAITQAGNTISATGGSPSDAALISGGPFVIGYVSTVEAW